MAILAAWAVLAGLLAGCAASPAEPPVTAEGHSFTDALGRPVTVRSTGRVAALMGSFAETWLLAGGELAGVTDDAFDERGIVLEEGVVSLGAYNSPGLEALLALEPDLVLLSAETQAHVELAGALDDAGVTAAYFSVTHFADYLEMLRTCTAITGRDDLYRQNGLAVQAAVEEVLNRPREGEAPTALLLITYSGGARVQNAATMTGGMLAELGCQNLADLEPSLLQEFSVEGVIARDPDYILAIPMGSSDEAARGHLVELVEQHPAWGGLTAVQENCYLLLDKERYLYKPNARWAESYEHLWELLYGEG